MTILITHRILLLLLRTYNASDRVRNEIHLKVFNVRLRYMLNKAWLAMLIFSARIRYFVSRKKTYLHIYLTKVNKLIYYSYCCRQH